MRWRTRSRAEPRGKRATHPGEVLLEEYLRPAELTQVDAARRMGVPLNRLNEVIRGKRGVLWKPLATSAPKLIALSIQQGF